MALIRSLEDQRVRNLKSLSYGANRPLVVKDLDPKGGPKTAVFNGLGLQASRRVDDLVRMTKFFTTPSGLKYLGNESLLASEGFRDRIKQGVEDKLGQRAERRKERELEPAKNPEGSIAGNILRGGRTILDESGKLLLSSLPLVGSTLAQVPVNGTGTHFLRGFRPIENTYLGSIPEFGQVDINDGSVESKLSSQRPFIPTPRKTDEGLITPLSSPIQDFRASGSKNVADTITEETTKTYSFNYQSKDIKRETRVNLGDQGSRKNLKSYTAPAEASTLDGLNILPPIKLASGADKKKIGTGIGRDLVKFRFEIITPEEESILYFRAFIESFDDSYTGDWSKTNYLGRGEAFYNYAGFDRSINTKFKIAAATRYEMQPLYQKMVMLASATAPTYGANFMRGTLCKLTIGDYVYNLPGFLEQVNYSWNNDYPWEISMQNPEGDIDDDQQELPHMLDCSVNFRPIHDFTPQTGLYHFITNPYPAGGASRFFNVDGSTKSLSSTEVVDSTVDKIKLQSTSQKEKESNE